MWRLNVILLLAISSVPLQASDLIVHKLNSSRQSAETSVSVLVPDMLDATVRHRVVYVLPVEANNEHRWGDSVAEFRRHDIPNRHQLICVFPTFSELPWYADHPTDLKLQQESYFLNDVVPFVDQHYSTIANRNGRLLVGFSKSGWGAWSLLLRHPDMFAKAAAFDAPMMMTAPGKYGSGPIFGTGENFADYQVSRLLESQRELLSSRPARLGLLGAGNFEKEHVLMRQHMQLLEIPFWVSGTSDRQHSWNSGWVSEAVEWLAATAESN